MQITSYEKSNTHRFEVPRMLFEDPENLEAYVANAKDKLVILIARDVCCLSLNRRFPAVVIVAPTKVKL